MVSLVNYLSRGFYSTQAFYRYGILQGKRYRSNIFIKLLGFPIRFFIIFFLWSIVLDTQNSDNFYYALYYAGVFLILLMYPYARTANGTVGQDIFSGEIVKYTTKGIPYWSVLLANWIVVVKFYVPIVFGLYLLSISIINHTFNPISILSFFYLLIIGSLMQLILWTLIGMTAFWLQQTQGVSRLFAFVQDLLTGALIPLELLPNNVQFIYQWLPFQYFVYVPIQVAMGRMNTHEILISIFASTLWAIGLLLLSLIIWNKGMKKYKDHV